MRRPVLMLILLGLLASSSAAAEAPPAAGRVRGAAPSIAAAASRIGNPTLDNLLARSDETFAAAGMGNPREFLERLKRQEDYLRLRTDPSGTPRPDLLLKGIEHQLSMPIDASLAPGSGVQGVQWSQIGPAPLRVVAAQGVMGAGPDSGEVTDIAIDPRNTTDRIIYIATNDGGIWKSTDGGATWAPKTDFFPSLSMGAVSLDPANPSIVYAGTGNLFDGNGRYCCFGAFSLKAVGIYRSVDSGETWTHLGRNLFTGIGINRIVLPAPGVLLVATSNGLYRSVDGGQNFGSNAPAFDNGLPLLGAGSLISDLKLDTATPPSATTPPTVYAAVAGQGIFRSTDGGVTFPTNLFSNPGGPTAPLAYISFTQSTQPNNQLFYANVAAGGGSNFKGIYRSADGGANWTQPAAAGLGGCQCGYDQTIALDPQNSSRLYVGMVNFFLSTDNAANFTELGGTAIHDDHHAITFSPQTHWGAAPTRMYVGEDGGIARTDDGGANWVNLNETQATNLLFTIDIGRGTNPANASEYSYGVTQDTGVETRRPEDPPGEWRLQTGGDGFAVAVDWTDARHAYAQFNGQLVGTTNAGDNWNVLAGTGLPQSACCALVSQLAVDPNNGANTYATDNTAATLYLSTDSGANYTAMNTFPAGVGRISTVKIDSNTMWVTLGNGQVAKTHNALAGASSTWTLHTIPGAPQAAVAPGFPVQAVPPSEVAIDPTNTDRVVVVYPSFTNRDPVNLTRHVFMTENDGATWRDIGGTIGGNPATNFPDLPANSVVIDPGTSPHSIIVATDAGILRTVDNGATWHRFGLALPTVQVTQLRLDPETDPPILRAGTYGRSTFELTAATGPLMAINGDLSFGNVGVGKFADRVIQVFNVGSQDLHVNSFGRSSGSPEFAKSSGPATPVTIQPGSHADFTVRFSPTSSGDKTAEFQINSDDPSEPTKILSASGRGVTGLAQVSGDLDFGTVARGTTGHRDVTVQNGGEAPLEVIDVVFTGGSSPSFSVAPNPSTPQTIQPGGSLVFPVRFSPELGAGPGTRTGTLRVETDDPAQPIVDLPARGTVGVPVATIGTSSVSYGGVPVDDRTEPNHEDATVTVANEASCSLCDLKVTGLSITGAQAGEFALVDPPSLPATVGAGNALDLLVRFNPEDAGPRAATLTISTDDPVTPTFTIPLDGRGLLPAIDALPPQLTFPPTVIDPQCATLCGTDRSTVVRNIGQAELIIDHNGTTGSPWFSTTAATDPRERLATSDETTKTVHFQPTASQRKVTGTLVVRDDLPSDAPVVEREVPMCGEAVGRGFRVLVVDRNGVPVSSIKSMKLQGHGMVSHVGINKKNLPLTTISPPDACNTIRFHYENQALPTTEGADEPGGFYQLTVQVGSKHTTLSFTLAVNEFKELVVTVG